MSLLKLDVLGLRNIQSATLLPSPTFNFIIGANASGKSSLLEAIFILGRARSFRTNHIKQAITFEQSQLIISARKQTALNVVSTLGMQIDSKNCLIRIDQQNRHKADLAYVMPVQLIQPKSYRLLDAGPQIRREFVDWGIFNQEATFLKCWRQFNRALQQRNAVLKSRQVRQLQAWDKELIEFGLAVTQFRQAYMHRLQPVFVNMAEHFLGLSQIELRFEQGWHAEYELAGVLAKDLEKDLRYGFTHSGPHRADFLVYQANRLAKEYLSRGQQKLLVLALIMSQVCLLDEQQQKACCILIDDLTAELDAENRAKLLKCLSRLGCQVFLTGTDLASFGDLTRLENFKVFHVEQGQIESR